MRTAAVGYVFTIALAVPIAVAVNDVGCVCPPALIVVALSATSLGRVMPVLENANHIRTPIGQTLVVATTVAPRCGADCGAPREWLA